LADRLPLRQLQRSLMYVETTFSLLAPRAPAERHVGIFRSAGARNTWGDSLSIDIALLPELADLRARGFQRNPSISTCSWFCQWLGVTGSGSRVPVYRIQTSVRSQNRPHLQRSQLAPMSVMAKGGALYATRLRTCRSNAARELQRRAISLVEVVLKLHGCVE
jgi:hypothetical protein